MNNLAVKECPLEECFFPNTSCGTGYMDVSQCRYYQQYSQPKNSDINPDKERFPWTGRPFGLKDLRCLSAVNRPQVIGFLGFVNAGKTTLLGFLFLMLYRGIKILQDGLFAGSLTLHGWEYISQYLQHSSNSPIQFPPHTSMSGRVPGLLHLRLLRSNRDIQDFVLTDAPGEWFSYWMNNVEDSNAAGARWIVSNSDKLIIIADTEELTRSSGGLARKNLEFLIRRAQSEFDKDEVALLWTKTDLTRPTEIVSNVNDYFTYCFPEAPVFLAQVPDTIEITASTDLINLQNLFSWIFNVEPKRIRISWPISTNVDPFLSYRGPRTPT